MSVSGRAFEDQVLELRDKGVLNQAIAVRFGCSPAEVNRAFNRANNRRHQFLQEQARRAEQAPKSMTLEGIRASLGALSA